MSSTEIKSTIQECNYNMDSGIQKESWDAMTKSRQYQVAYQIKKKVKGRKMPQDFIASQPIFRNTEHPLADPLLGLLNLSVQRDLRDLNPSKYEIGFLIKKNKNSRTSVSTQSK